MNFIRVHILIRFLCLATAFHVFNYNVDVPVPMVDANPKDLNFNEIESFVEMVSEEDLNVENTIPERNGSDDNYDLDCFVTHKAFKISNNRRYSKDNGTFEYRKQYSKQIHAEIISPPPKA